MTLTLTTPAPLGPNATLLTGAGDGTGLLVAQTTTNQANSYSNKDLVPLPSVWGPPGDPPNTAVQNLPPAGHGGL